MSYEIFAGEDGTYIRVGECNRCGACCRGNPFDPEDGSEYCPLFRWLDEGVGHCDDRNHPYYLSGCNLFPSRPSQIEDKPNCSYEFLKISNGSPNLQTS